MKEMIAYQQGQVVDEAKHKEEMIMLGKKNKRMKQERPRKMSIRLKILVPATVLLVAVCALLGYNSYSRFQENLLGMGVEEAVMAAGVTLSSCSSNAKKRV